MINTEELAKLLFKLYCPIKYRSRGRGWSTAPKFIKEKFLNDAECIINKLK